LDKKQLRDKLRKFDAGVVDIFQDAIELSANKFLWLIFVRRFIGAPQSIQSDGPYRLGRSMFNKGRYFYRDGDEVKQCQSDGDIERIFRGFSSEHLSAYNYEVDELYFRLLHPNCEKFVGRREKIDEIKTKLALRHPIVALLQKRMDCRVKPGNDDVSRGFRAQISITAKWSAGPCGTARPSVVWPLDLKLPARRIPSTSNPPHGQRPA
jgi:hypothetical protein